MIKRLAAAGLGLLLLLSPLQVMADELGVDLKLDEDLPEGAIVSTQFQDSLPARSAILMDQKTGKVLYEQDPDQQLPPASITKVMTLLLVMEALDKGKITLEDKVPTSEYASSMGGSQIWLEVGEEMTVDELLKAVAISSANDAAVALGEFVEGSNDAFVDRMNYRAKELGMENTHYVNCTGLDEDGHLTTARDIATVSRELMKHPTISEYSTVWMDSLRGGETELVNTNKLVRFYNGATGLKTGTTSGAGVCLSATATRDDLSLIAVVLGCPTSDARFAAARGLLDYGFAHYMSVAPPAIHDQIAPVKVLRGIAPAVELSFEDPGTFIVNKQDGDALEQEITMVPDVQAPVEKGQVLGKVDVVVGGEVIGSYDLKAAHDVDMMGFFKAFGILMRSLLQMQKDPVQQMPAPMPIPPQPDEEAEPQEQEQEDGVETMGRPGDEEDSWQEDDEQQAELTYEEDGEPGDDQETEVTQEDDAQQAEGQSPFRDSEPGMETAARAEDDDAWNLMAPRNRIEPPDELVD